LPLPLVAVAAEFVSSPGKDSGNKYGEPRCFEPTGRGLLVSPRLESFPRRLLSLEAAV
jgi:hypothetical protein